MKVVAVHAFFFSARRELKQKKERLKKKRKLKMKTQTSQNISCYNIFSCRVAVEARATVRFTVETKNIRRSLMDFLIPFVDDH